MTFYNTAIEMTCASDIVQELRKLKYKQVHISLEESNDLGVVIFSGMRDGNANVKITVTTIDKAEFDAHIEEQCKILKEIETSNDNDD